MHFVMFVADLLIKGNESEFGGMLSVTNIRKTIIDRRVVTPMDTFSPESTKAVVIFRRQIVSLNRPLSDGTQKPRNATIVMRKHGRIMLNT